MNHLCGNILQVPDKDNELEVVHIIIKNTTPKISRVWHKLKWKIDTTVERGEGAILIGDLNRPLQVERPSFGTRLLEQW